MNICFFTLKNLNKILILKFQIVSAIFTILLGTVLHFTFQWSNKNSFIGVFSAVNESTWEHLKLLFYPMLVTIILGNFFVCKTIPNFICAKTIGLIVSILFTIIFFYTYTGILGKNFAILNILTFIFATILGEYVAYKLIVYNFKCNNTIAIISLIILFSCFVIFTFYPPKIGLFKDHITGKYGITNN